MRCVVSGRLEQREYNNREGEKRSAIEVVADEIGPSLKWATAQVERNPRDASGQGGGASNRGQGGQTAGGDENPFGGEEEPF